MPPAEIVSTPSSSASATASSTASGSPMPTSGPSANALSYSTRAEPPLLVRRIRSQPIEHDAQESRTAARSSSASSVVSAPKLWPGSAESALKVSRLESVPASRYFAVAGPKESARSAFEAASTAGRVVDGRAAVGADGDRLEELGAHHRAEPAAAGVAAVVRDRREADELLARRPDRGHPVGGAEPRAQRLLRGGGRQAPEVARGLEPRAVLVDDQDAGRVTGAADDDRIVAGPLAGDREVARRERVVEPVGQRRLRDDGELRARGQRRAHERGEDEGERRLRRERVAAVGPELAEQVGAQPRAADRPAQDIVPQREGLRAPVAEVHDQGPAEVAARRHAS